MVDDRNSFDEKELPVEVEKLLEHDEVVGIFRGYRRRNGTKTTEPCFSIRVRRKLTLSELDAAKKEAFPKEINGIRIDVVEVGGSSTTSLSVTSCVHGSDDRESTASAFFNLDNTAWALVSGHGVLPYRGEHILRNYNEGNPITVISVTEIGGPTHDGQVVAGSCGSGSVDWALVELNANPNNLAKHPSGGTLPIQIRPFDLIESTKLQFYSRLSNRSNHGYFDGVGSLKIKLPDNSVGKYSGIFTIDPTLHYFSKPGDSGALVVDNHGWAVGVVLGAAWIGGDGYVVPVKALNDTLPDRVWKKIFSCQ